MAWWFSGGSALSSQARAAVARPSRTPDGVETGVGASTFLRTHAWTFAVWTGMLAWSAALFATERRDYLEFRLARFDLGNMVQAVWSTAHGRPLEVTDATGDQVVRLASHVDPVLVLLAPFWIVAPSPLTLAAIQIAGVASGALPVFWLARRHLGSEKAAGLLALAYLAYPWLAWTALDAMHPVTLAIPFFLYGIWFLDSRRLWPFAACALLALSTGELMGLPLAALGIWYWLARGERRVGLTTVAAGITWTLVSLELVVPAFRDGESRFYERYESVGGSPLGIAETVFTDPGAIVSALTSSADLAYVLWLGVPLAGVFLLAPALAAVALPQLVLNALSDWSTTTDARHHYIAAIVPFLVAAAVFGVARLPESRRTRAAGSTAFVSLAFGLLLGPWPGLPGQRPVGFHAVFPAAHVEALREAESLVPKDAPVSATNIAGSRLSARRYFYSVPELGKAEWIVLDTWNNWVPGTDERTEGVHPELVKDFLDRIQASPRWTRVFERDGVYVFGRTRGS
jgi:uncharacterized membrane protein